MEIKMYKLFWIYLKLSQATEQISQILLECLVLSSISPTYANVLWENNFNQIAA